MRDVKNDGIILFYNETEEQRNEKDQSKPSLMVASVTNEG